MTFAGGPIVARFGYWVLVKVFLSDTGWGIAVSEIFGVIREDSQCCV